ncbi:cysteine proteinase, partial [Myriangium duriaei CBS 260.36]
WLNDEVVNAWYANLCARLNERDGYVKGPNNVPRWVAYSTAWYKNATERGVSTIAGWSRRKGIKNDKLLQAERIFFPTNTGAHWTLLTISGKHKTIEYLDSMNAEGYGSKRNIDLAKKWLQMELGGKFVEDEWKILRTTSAQQNNMNDCGVFACLNGWALGKGLEDPSGEFEDGEIPLARRMVAAVLMNGGFTGEFDL